MAIVKAQRKFSECSCHYRHCGESFDPKTKNQLYCSKSHKVAEWNLQKFEKAVEAAVQERLRQLGYGETMATTTNLVGPKYGE